MVQLCKKKRIKVTHVKFGDGEVILMSRTAIGSDQGREKLFGLDNGTVFFSSDQTILLSTATETRVPSYSPTLMQAMTCAEKNSPLTTYVYPRIVRKDSW